MYRMTAIYLSIICLSTPIHPYPLLSTPIQHPPPSSQRVPLHPSPGTVSKNTTMIMMLQMSVLVLVLVLMLMLMLMLMKMQRMMSMLMSTKPNPTATS